MCAGLISGFTCAAEAPVKEPPPGYDFVRMLDIEGYFHETISGETSSQNVRIRTRYLDTDVNAFVGFMAAVEHFNNNALTIKDPPSTVTSSFMTNWGGVFGLKRGIHLWELDVMGATLGNALAPAAAIVGEHSLGKRLIFFHRTEANLFVGDTVVDQDQGIYWMFSRKAGLQLGYRFFASKHMGLSGPHAGFTLRFESPRIPFLFPSIG